MPTATNGDVTINYETHGEPGAIPLVLIEGFTAQLIGWREEFVALLVSRGHRVILLDNRDVGLSSQTGGPDDPDDLQLRHEGSVAIAAAIPGAELHLYAGMGHELPRALWGEFADVVSRTVLRAE